MVALVEKKKRTKTAPEILGLLAREGPKSKWQMKKATGKSYGNIHETVKALLDQGLIVKKMTRPSEKNPKIDVEYYDLTFKGFLKYFASHLPKNPEWRSVQKYYEENRENLRRAILRVQKSYPEEKIFTEWNTIEKWQGKTMSYYQICLAAAYTLKHTPLVIEDYERERIFLYYLKNEEPEEPGEKVEARISNIIKKEDTLWRLYFEENFALHYMELTLSNKVLDDYMKGKITPIHNKNLYNFFQEIIDNKIREAEDRIQKLSLMKKAFKALFKGEEK